jgi:prephenate dehydratase
LEENFSSAKFIQTPSTASAFEKIKGEGLVDSIAIGPKIAAEIYGLKVIKEDVQDEGNNETSFVVIKRESSESSSADKTTIVVNPKVDRPGLLYDILEVFKGKGVNLSKIESRPSRDKLGSYIFYLTLDIGENPLLVKIIEELEAMHIEVYNFGSYNRIRV